MPTTADLTGSVVLPFGERQAALSRLYSNVGGTHHGERSWSLNTVAIQQHEELQDVPGPAQSEAVLARELLDSLQGEHVSL